MKCCCDGSFWVGLLLGMAGGAGLTCLLHPRCRKAKTAPGRAMEQVSDRVDKAAYRIRCAVKN